MVRFNNCVKVDGKQRKIIDNALFDYYIKTLTNPRNHSNVKELNKKIEDIKAVQRKFMLPVNRRVNKKSGFGVR